MRGRRAVGGGARQGQSEHLRPPRPLDAAPAQPRPTFAQFGGDNISGSALGAVSGAGERWEGWRAAPSSEGPTTMAGAAAGARARAQAFLRFPRSLSPPPSLTGDKSGAAALRGARTWPDGRG